MAKKNVNIYVVEMTSLKSFKDILLSEEFKTPIKINDFKTSELKFIQEHKNGTITGIFVTTQKKGIPPKHKPGDDDYSAIPLEDGEGLAYPNTILYDPHTNTLYLESNKIGLSDARVTDYFNKHAERLGLQDFNFSLGLVLKQEAYQRINKMVYIESIDCRIATPLEVLKNQAKQGPLSGFKKFATEMNASKSILVTVKSEEIKGGINKKAALGLANFFKQNADSDTNDKLIIKGRKQLNELNEGELIEEEINFLLDKIQGSFKLDEPIVASHIQAVERKRGIEDVYLKKHDEVKNIVGHIKA